MFVFDANEESMLWGRFQKELHELRFKNPMMFAVLATAAGIADQLAEGPLVITSIYRPDDPQSVHAFWRGVDVRIYHPDRPLLSPKHRGLSETGAELVVDQLSRAFEYKKMSGEASSVAIIHGEGMNRHLHLQAPSGERWIAG